MVEPFSGNPVDGELVEAGRDGVTLLTDRRSVVRFQRSDCERVTVAAYRTYDSVPQWWTGLGMASTLSHGGFLIISAPVWLITGGATLVFMHNRPIHRYPDDPLESLAAFARFPQGIPPGFTPP